MLWAELLASMAVQGKLPKCAIVVSVRQAYFHCAKALLRSKLWTGEYALPQGTFPSISRMIASNSSVASTGCTVKRKWSRTISDGARVTQILVYSHFVLH